MARGAGRIQGVSQAVKAGVVITSAFVRVRLGSSRHRRCCKRGSYLGPGLRIAAKHPRFCSGTHHSSPVFFCKILLFY